MLDASVSQKSYIITMKFVQNGAKASQNENVQERGVTVILAAISRPVVFSHHLPLNCLPVCALAFLAVQLL